MDIVFSSLAFRITSGRYPDILQWVCRGDCRRTVAPEGEHSYVWPPSFLDKAGASRLALWQISSRMTHLNDPRMTEVKHELARIPTLDLNFSHGSLLFVFYVISSVILGYSRITCRKDELQIAASMQALTLVLVTPVPQGAHWLIRKQVHSDDQSLHPLQ